MGKEPYSVDTVLVNRPTVAAYASLKGDVKAFVDAVIRDGLKPNSVLRVSKKVLLHRKNKEVKPKLNDFWQLSWGDIIELRNEVSENNLTAVLKLVYDINDKDFLKLDLFNCFAVYKWITKQLLQLDKTENQELGGELSQDEKNAGAQQLNAFGYAASLDAVANGDIMKYDSILEKPYAVVFRKMCLEKTKADIQKRYLENARRKVKAGR